MGIMKGGKKGEEMKRNRRGNKKVYEVCRYKERRVSKKEGNQRIAATIEAMVKFEGVEMSVLILPYLAIFSSSRSLGSTSKLRSYIS